MAPKPGGGEPQDERFVAPRPGGALTPRPGGALPPSPGGRDRISALVGECCLGGECLGVGRGVASGVDRGVARGVLAGVVRLLQLPLEDMFGTHVASRPRQRSTFCEGRAAKITTPNQTSLFKKTKISRLNTGAA